MKIPDERALRAMGGLGEAGWGREEGGGRFSGEDWVGVDMVRMMEGP